VVFAFVVSLLVFSTGNVTLAGAESAQMLAAAIFKEFFVGFALSFSIYLVFNIIFFMGQLIDYQIGFSMVSVFDPVTQIQAPVTGNLLYMAVLAMLVQTGGLNALIALICHSYAIVPAGGYAFLGNAALAKQTVESLSSFIVMAVQLSLPVVGAMVVIDVAMGLLVKAVPQMNIFVVGMPIKLLAGLALVYLMSPMVSGICRIAFDKAYGDALQALKGMAPQ
jgi:flagellar biosynthetic protein FliR